MPTNPFKPLRTVGPLDTPVEYDLVDWYDDEFDYEGHVAGLFVDYNAGPSLLKIAAVWVATLAACLTVWASVIVGAILIVKAAS